MVELGEYDILFEHRTVVKWQVVIEFLAALVPTTWYILGKLQKVTLESKVGGKTTEQNRDPSALEPNDQTKTQNLMNAWTLFVGASSNQKGA